MGDSTATDFPSGSTITAPSTAMMSQYSSTDAQQPGIAQAQQQGRSPLGVANAGVVPAQLQGQQIQGSIGATTTTSGGSLSQGSPRGDLVQGMAEGRQAAAAGGSGASQSTSRSEPPQSMGPGVSGWGSGATAASTARQKQEGAGGAAAALGGGLQEMQRPSSMPESMPVSAGGVQSSSTADQGSQIQRHSMSEAFIAGGGSASEPALLKQQQQQQHQTSGAGGAGAAGLRDTQGLLSHMFSGTDASSSALRSEEGEGEGDSHWRDSYDLHDAKVGRRRRICHGVCIISIYVVAWAVKWWGRR